MLFLLFNLNNMKLDPKYLYFSELHRISCRTLKIDYNESLSLIRRNKYVEPRFLTIYLAKHKKLIHYLSHDDIAKFFGKKEHSVVNNAIKKVGNWIETGAESYCGIKMSDAVMEIENKFKEIKLFEYYFPDHNELREFRLKRNLSYRYVARGIGMNHEVIRDIEDGKDVYLSSLKKLCNFYIEISKQELGISE